MSKTVEFLLSRKREIEAELKPLHVELEQIDAALAAIDQGAPTLNSAAPTVTEGATPPAAKLTVNEAIIEAVKNDAGTPTQIHDFLAGHLGVSTTKASISTRLSKLRAENLLAHDGHRWVLPRKEKPADDQSLQDASAGLFSNSEHGREAGQGGGT